MLAATDAETIEELATILYTDCFASTTQWDVEKLITELQHDDPDSGTGPLDNLWF